MHVLIRVVRPNREAENIELVPDQKVLLGREVGDVVLGDPQCSSRHAELSWNGAELVYRDLGSTNGSFVDGARITERVLQAGQSVSIGACRIEFAGLQGAGRTVVAQPAVGPAGTQVAMPLALAKPAAVVAKAEKSPPQKPQKPQKPTSAKKLSTAAMVLIGAGSLLAFFAVWIIAVALWRGEPVERCRPARSS